MSAATPSDLAPGSRLILERLGAEGLLAAYAAATGIEEARDLYERELPLFGAPPPVATVEDVEVAREGGGEAVRVRLYHPTDRPTARAILWIHGGGWVLGNLGLFDTECGRLSLATGSLVVSVDYRLAPEHPFPAGLDDAATVLGWMERELRGPDGETPRLIVGGASAGGNLAAALALRARDADGPRIEHQILIYPVTDCGCDTPSYREFAAGYLLEGAEMKLFWELYAGGPERARDPLASVLRAPEVGNLPPATVVLAGCDVLRDEGYAYAARLAAAAVPAKVLLYPGEIHGFCAYGAISPMAEVVDREIAFALGSG